jgi:hypothetical protein
MRTPRVERGLILLLRLQGGMLLLAVPAVFLPLSWMVAVLLATALASARSFLP